MQEISSIMHQRMQNGWINELIYIFKLLRNRAKQITNCHALQMCVVVENWCLQTAAKGESVKKKIRKPPTSYFPTNAHNVKKRRVIKTF